MTLLEKEWFIQAPWGRLCIVAWGDCYDPPVLVCHGTKDSAASFRPLMKLLPHKFYYIGMELPGCGRSDPMPPGLMLSAYDLMYSIQVVVKHFRWENFLYIGHSMACSLGALYDLSYPGKMSGIVQLDPVTIGLGVPPEKFSHWYKSTFTDYFNNYDKYQTEEKPNYTKEQVIEKIIKRRGLTKETAKATLDRWSEPSENGLIRITCDPRIEVMATLPFPIEYIKKLMTNVTTPTLAVIAEDSKKAGKYDAAPFLFDETSYPNKNYRVRVVPGNHDVHIIYPERIASYVAQFLIAGFDGLENKAKL